MRRGVNPQTQDYVQDGELVCFGVSEHILEEKQFEWTPKARRDQELLKNWFPRDDLTIITRPCYKSDFNWTNYATRAQLRCLLGLAFIRELPIKNFYVRCWLAYGWIVFFIIRVETIKKNYKSEKTDEYQ